MIDKLLDYYQRELTFLRELGAEFAQRFPKIAGRLRMDGEAIEDPHVSRFIEASALLSARTRLKIDDQFPDICQAILQTLYPFYLSPLPPSMIVQLGLKETSADNPDGYVVKRGARLESNAVEGETCRFRTCFETRLWPFLVKQVDYLVPPLPFEKSPWNREVQAAIRLRLVCATPKLRLADLNVESLRFYLGGSPACSNALIEALFGQVLGVGLANEQNTIRWLAKEAVVPIGYGDDQSLLPSNAQFIGLPNRERVLRSQREIPICRCPSGRSLESCGNRGRDRSSLLFEPAAPRVAAGTRRAGLTNRLHARRESLLQARRTNSTLNQCYPISRDSQCARGSPCGSVFRRSCYGGFLKRRGKGIPALLSPPASYRK